MALGSRGDLFRRAASDDLSALITCFGTQINDPVCAFNDIEVMLDDEDGVARVHETLKDLEQHTDIVEVQARCWFVEQEKCGPLAA